MTSKLKKNPLPEEEFEDLNIADKMPEFTDGQDDAYLHLYQVITNHFAKETHLHKKLKDKDIYIN